MSNIYTIDLDNVSDAQLEAVFDAFMSIERPESSDTRLLRAIGSTPECRRNLARFYLRNINQVLNAMENA